MSDHSADGAEAVRTDARQFEVAAKNPRRAEQVTAGLFLLAVLAFAGFGAAYWVNANNFWLGGTLGAGMSLFGAGFVTWGKYLMPRGPFEEPRAMMEVTPAEQEALISDFASRGRVAVKRRGFIIAIMGAAGAIFSIVALFPLLRSLGPLPKKTLATTKWKKGAYLTTTDGRHIKVDDIPVGSFVTVFPQNDVGGALSQTILIHVDDQGDIKTMPGRDTWGPSGYLAFSKVCTHAGCPVGLYEQLTELLLCPCHQSMFNVREGALPIFGPAPRPLPQLPLYVDSSGYLRAQDGYNEPIGPGFWERGGQL
jgi:ubiquinol-cytochrome c reductase iron-sulfur subunit